MKVDAIKDKVKQTNLERYGVEFPNQSIDFRNQQKIILPINLTPALYLLRA